MLPVQKPGTKDHRPVQDLREVNTRVETVHLMVPNPHTLLSRLPPSHQVYTVLDLKDAFFTLPLAKASQPLFAFEREEPERLYSGRLTGTRLPQGFENSPTLFDDALKQDLVGFRHGHPEGVLLRYAVDLLLAAEMELERKQAAEDPLQELDKDGSRVSAKKAQPRTPRVTYLGHHLQKGNRTLSSSRIEAVPRVPQPRAPSDGCESSREPQAAVGCGFRGSQK